MIYIYVDKANVDEGRKLADTYFSKITNKEVVSVDPFVPFAECNLCSLPDCPSLQSNPYQLQKWVGPGSQLVALSPSDWQAAKETIVATLPVQ